RSGVRHERDRFAAHEPLDERGRLPTLIVLVEARRRSRDRVVLEEPRRPSSVFSRDEGDVAKHPERAQRHILEVADGGGDHIQVAGNCAGRRFYQMYSAEPLPHFVDEYLAWLHEVHPTNATFDGVHLHDDLIEDLSRAAIDAQARDLGAFARRLAAIDPARLTDAERLERPALASNIPAPPFELQAARTWARHPPHHRAP